MNQRLHWARKARETKDIRRAAFLLSRHIPDLDKCGVRMIWTVPDRRRRDAENTMPTLKALCDGLVDAEIVPDDTPEFMAKEMTEIVYVKGVSKVQLKIWEL